MTFNYQIGDGAHSLDQQLELDYKRGYQVIDAAGGSNLVDDNNTSDTVVRAAAGDINFGGTTVSCAQETVDLGAVVDPDNPRKVTLYRDGSGKLDYAAGTPEPAQDTGESRRNAYRPAPPTLYNTDAVILATTWVAAGVSSITDADIRDRRQPAELDVGSVSSNSVNTDKGTFNHGLVRGRNDERLDASKFDGSDADDRLGNALSVASGGEVIYLEATDYTTPRTISKRVTFVGTEGLGQNRGTDLNATWTLSDHVTITNVAISSDIDFNSDNCVIQNATINASVTTDQDRTVFTEVTATAGDITFDSGTSGGLVDSSYSLSVTDNGTNTVGDVA